MPAFPKRPVLPQDATREQRAQFERTVAVARFFGGTPRTASGAAGQAAAPVPVPLPAVPKVEVAAPAAGSIQAPPAKRKKEGC